VTHDYHEQLPGFREGQILHDGCGECESRGQELSMAISAMDNVRFIYAWHRAARWNLTSDVLDVSAAERPLLEALWAVQLRLETTCGLPPGDLPLP
jgi:hypothetical protein